VVIRYPAQNQTVNGIFVLCRIVPAVSETLCQLPRHYQRRSWTNSYPRLCTHREQTKPSSQRQAAKYCWHASSLANFAWNSRKVFGNGGRDKCSYYRSWSAETTV